MFRTKLRELRETKGLSQKQLAIELGISQGAIGNWESGVRKPNYEVIKKLSDYFGVTADYIIGRENSQSTQVFPSSSIESAIINEIGSLSNPEKEEVLNFIRFKKERK